MSVWYCKQCDQLAIYGQRGILPALEWVDEDGNPRCRFGEPHPSKWQNKNGDFIFEYLGEFE